MCLEIYNLQKCFLYGLKKEIFMFILNIEWNLCNKRLPRYQLNSIEYKILKDQRRYLVWSVFFKEWTCLFSVIMTSICFKNLFLNNTKQFYSYISNFALLLGHFVLKTNRRIPLFQPYMQLSNYWRYKAKKHSDLFFETPCMILNSTIKITSKMNTSSRIKTT